MAVERIYCPYCGNALPWVEGRSSVFCHECGKELELQGATDIIKRQNQSNNVAMPSAVGATVGDIDERLEEVDFYYSLSTDKKEVLLSDDANPTYYLKAQDLLIELSQLYPSDYRIWWQLCKPLDFFCVNVAGAITDNFAIIEDYFNKAIGLAKIEDKRNMIAEYDQYQLSKELIKRELAPVIAARNEEILKKKAAEDEAEAKAKAKADADAEAEARAIVQENEEMSRKFQEEEARTTLLLQEKQNRENALFADLAAKDYRAIDDSYFIREGAEGQTMISIFKVVTGMLYLLAFRQSPKESHTIYREQTLVVQIDKLGNAVKVDGNPVRVRGLPLQHDFLNLTFDQQGSLCACASLLIYDHDYIVKVMQSAKKPLLSLEKIFF